MKVSNLKLVVLLLAINTCLLIWGSLRHTPNWDEVGHLPAGLSHYCLGNFDLYSVNPPAVRLIAALPVWLADPNVDWTIEVNKPSARNEFRVGLQFLQINSLQSFWYFSIARWACIPFSWLGAITCFYWSRDLYGGRAAVVATTIWCFSPSVLAYGQMITPAVGATSTGLLANYQFYRWLKRPTWQQALVAGLALGLAQITKTTWLILYVLWPVIWLVYSFPLTRGAIPRAVSEFLLMVLLSLYVINVGYLFEGTFQTLGSFNFVSRTLGGSKSDGVDVGNRFREHPIGKIPIPLPRNYIAGIDVQKRDFEGKMWSYCNGQWRRGGWWYYYLYAMLIKMPVGIQLLMLIAIADWFRRSDHVEWRTQFVLLMPALCVLALVSSQTGFNHHLRYVMPAFPALFILASGVFSRPRSVFVCRLMKLGLTSLVVSSLMTWPHNRSYFNEFVGGPQYGHWYLGGASVDTNVDCGQDLLYLKRWLQRHSQVERLKLSFNGAVDPQLVGIFATPPPELPEPGWFAISVNHLHMRSQTFEYFNEFRPAARVGYSICIYELGEKDVDEWYKRHSKLNVK